MVERTQNFQGITPTSDQSGQDDPQWNQQMKEFSKQIAREAREQWSAFDMECVEAFKRGDRIGLLFEGGTPFQPINEKRLEMALNSNQGSDESSMYAARFFRHLLTR